jgi:hypothetical protein
MGFKDSLKKAGEQGQDATRRVLGHAREQWEDAERRIRASMRIHPRPKQNVKSSFAAQPSSAESVLNEGASKAQAASAPQSGGSARENEVKKKDVA